MKRLSQPYINKLVVRYEKLASISEKKKHLNRTLRLIKTLSFIRYKFYMGYKNDFIENRIRNLAQHIVKFPFVDSSNEKSIAIIDEINADYVGLMTQYLAPFISDGYKILYIYEQIEHRGDVRTHLMKSLNTYDKATVKEIPASKKGFAKSQWIYNEICAYGARKILMNFGEWAIEHCVACYALPKKCVKYHINACDHTFWAGVSCADYSFEFRHYGANLSYKERGLNKGQIVYLPFYPVMEAVPFLGLPDECAGKFIFLTGGAPYKIVDKEKTFFRLCKNILNRCPNAIVLYVGDNTGSVVSSGIEEFGLKGKFIFLGYRNDILEVFRHSDVFINTYPIGGGVMCQFAAHCSKPIINYIYSSVEESISQKSDCHFTYFNENDFVKEGVKLYEDYEYRKGRGEVLHNAVVSKEEFDEALLSFMSAEKKVYEVKWNDGFCPRKLNSEDAINYNNKSLFVFYFLLFKQLGWDSLWTMPGNVVSCGVDWLARKMKKYLNNKI